MTHRKAIDSVREEFEELLEAKTSWGRNEIKSLFERAVSNHYMLMADNSDKVDSSVLKKKIKTTRTTQTYSRALSSRKRNRNKED